MEVVDSHAHLDFESFRDDRAEVIARAFAAGVECIITIGLEHRPGAAAEAVAIAASHDRIFATVGVHPHDASLGIAWTGDAGALPTEKQMRDWREVQNPLLQRLASLALHPKVVALGETGLDYHYDHSPREMQRALFRSFIRLARERHLPLVVHTREAAEDTVAIMREERAELAGGVIHCYGGSTVLERAAAEMGFHLGITGIVTYRNASGLREAVSRIAPDRLLAETDCPYLSPVPYRGRRNEPAFVLEVVRALAAARRIPAEEAARVTTENARRLFGLDAWQRRGAGRFVYPYGAGLYINLTNRCTLGCTFCLKRRGHTIAGLELGLLREPTTDEVHAALRRELAAAAFDEVVFCGIGEPLLRLAEVKAIGAALKRQGMRVRVNTDGLASLVHDRDVPAELAGCVDAISVSLNAADAPAYSRICPSVYGERAHAAVCDFIRRAVAVFPSGAVQATAVAVPGLDREAVAGLAGSLGARFRMRGYAD